MQDKLNFIRQKCIEANPDIAAEKFGCEAEDGYGNTWVYNGWEWWGKEKMMKNRATSLGILGRPIRLADVLLVLPMPTFIFLFPDRLFIGEPPSRCSWNLLADDLREQSEETSNFIYELLQ